MLTLNIVKIKFKVKIENKNPQSNLFTQGEDKTTLAKKLFCKVIVLAEDLLVLYSVLKVLSRSGVFFKGVSVKKKIFQMYRPLLYLTIISLAYVIINTNFYFFLQLS